MSLFLMIEQERRFFKAHCEEWSEFHKGEYALVKGEELIGFFAEETDALAEGARRFGTENFLVRRVGGAERQQVRAPALSLGILQSKSVQSDSDQ